MPNPVTKHALFEEVPISAIRPEGWIRRYLENQREGLTGHLEAAGFAFNTKGWSEPDGRAIFEWWGPYEQCAYWVDGMIRCGSLIGDRALIEKGGAHVRYVLDHAAPDGFLGAELLRKEDKPVGRDGADGTEFLPPDTFIGRWPIAVFFRAMQAYASGDGEQAMAEAMRKHYLCLGLEPHVLHRNICNVESMLWAYERAGDRALLDLAQECYREYNKRTPAEASSMANMKSDEKAYEHGVTYCETTKLPVILYLYTGNREYLDAALNAYRKLDRDHMMVDGVISSNEFLAGKGSLVCHETCDIADYTWSAGYLLMATGDADWADKIERAVFNAAPGAVLEDFTALQYFSAPNQMIADATSNHNEHFRGRTWMSFRPNHEIKCCPGEVNRIMPNYAARMWMRTPAGGIAPVFYGASRFETTLDGGKRVAIDEATDYPFSERIRFTIHVDSPVRFPLALRIPGWCSGASIKVNGNQMSVDTRPRSFVTLDREFRDGDVIELDLPMTLKLTRWPEGGIAIERGPLVFSLPIAEDRQIAGGDESLSAEFPAYNLYATSPWNYALALDEGDLDAVIVQTREVKGFPWTVSNAPITLEVPVRRVKGWKLRKLKRVRAKIYTMMTLHGEFTFVPPLPSEKSLPSRLGKRTETVKLVPYGCTNLRVTIFPSGKADKR